MNTKTEPVETILARLADTLESRRQTSPAQNRKSYTASLFAKGEDAILKKIGEEATEAVMACKDNSPDRIIAEMADLWFHCLIALAQHGLRPEQVLRELARREGASGIEEKAKRLP